MERWTERASIQGDVVYFSYVEDERKKDSPEVHVWDLDKTYLDTGFETLRGIWKIIFESAEEKKNIPGTDLLVKCLSQSWEERVGDKHYPLFFITASPPQLEEKIVKKLHLDNLEPFALFCKDNLKNLRPRLFRRLTQQIGFKLQSLLQMRKLLAEEVRIVLWGDDSESDALVYNLFSDICSRRLDEIQLEHILKSLGVELVQRQMIFSLQSDIPRNDPVEKIYINLAFDTDPEYYLKYGRRVLPTWNTFQVALDLFQDCRIRDAHLLDIAKYLRKSCGFTKDEMEKSFDSLIRRKVLSLETVEFIAPILKDNKVLRTIYEPSIEPRPVEEVKGDRVYQLEGTFEPWVPERIDYLHDYR